MTSVSKPVSILQPRLGILTIFWLLAVVAAYLPLAVQWSPNHQGNEYSPAFFLIGVGWGLALLGGWIATSPPLNKTTSLVGCVCFIAAVRLNAGLVASVQHPIFDRQILLLGAFVGVSVVAFRLTKQPMWHTRLHASRDNPQFSILGLMLLTIAVAIWLMTAKRYGGDPVPWLKTTPLMVAAFLSNRLIAAACYSPAPILPCLLAMIGGNAFLLFCFRLNDAAIFRALANLELPLCFSLGFTGMIFVTTFLGRLDDIHYHRRSQPDGEGQKTNTKIQGNFDPNRQS
jgi:hypothetical protein